MDEGRTPAEAGQTAQKAAAAIVELPSEEATAVAGKAAASAAARQFVELSRWPPKRAAAATLAAVDGAGCNGSSAIALAIPALARSAADSSAADGAMPVSVGAAAWNYAAGAIPAGTSGSSFDAWRGVASNEAVGAVLQKRAESIGTGTIQDEATIAAAISAQTVALEKKAVAASDSKAVGRVATSASSALSSTASSVSSAISNSAKLASSEISDGANAASSALSSTATSASSALVGTASSASSAFSSASRAFAGRSPFPAAVVWILLTSTLICLLLCYVRGRSNTGLTDSSSWTDPFRGERSVRFCCSTNGDVGAGPRYSALSPQDGGSGRDLESPLQSGEERGGVVGSGVRRDPASAFGWFPKDNFTAGPLPRMVVVLEKAALEQSSEFVGPRAKSEGKLADSDLQITYDCLAVALSKL
ncbi:unnamed protein product, partial [Polarella glacialis]